MNDPHLPATTTSPAVATDWSQFSLDALWAMVDGEDGQVSWPQYYAWARMAQLCEDQADQLHAAMNQVATRWPPRPGSASLAMVAWIESLVSSMRRSATAATGTHRALRDITIILTGARGELAALLDQRRAYEVAEQQWQPHPAPSPGQSPASSPTLPRPPAAWRTDLDLQAQSVMAAADTTIGAQAQSMQVPPRFTMYATFEKSAAFHPDNGLVSATSASRSERSAAGSAAPVHQPLFGHSGSVPSGSPPPLSNGNASDGVGPPPTTGPPADSQQPSFVVTTYGTVLAAGGVIGASAASRALTALGPTRFAADGAEPARVPANGAGPILSGGSPTGPSSQSSGRAVAYSGGRRRPRQPDPADPWQVAEGGPTVLTPPRMVADHDPGPGVIGLPR